jgi:limonene-1,2-epoxide hydrolase
MVSATMDDSDIDVAAIARRLFADFAGGVEATEKALKQAAWDDLTMEQPGLPTVTGVEALVQLTRMLAATLDFEAIDVEVRNLAHQGSVVMVERVDHMRRSDGTVVGSYPVTGVLEFEQGRIRAWREYFDTRELFRLLPPEVAAMLGEA